MNTVVNELAVLKKDYFDWKESVKRIDSRLDNIEKALKVPRSSQQTAGSMETDQPPVPTATLISVTDSSESSHQDHVDPPAQFEGRLGSVENSLSEIMTVLKSMAPPSPFPNHD